MNYWKLVSCTDEEIIGNIYDKKNAENAAYTFTFKMEGDYPQLYIKDNSSKDEIIYYSNMFKYDGNNPEYLYHHALDNLKKCITGSSYKPAGYNSYISGSEYLQYIHGIFTKIKDYKDVSDYLAKFAIYKDQLVNVISKNENVFGATNTSTNVSYTYLSDGTIGSIYYHNGFREDYTRPLKVATKFPGIAKQYYMSQNREIEVIKLYGSIELAPLLGLSDVIVDIVETGKTLVENGLSVREEIVPISARLIANKTSYKFLGDEINKIASELKKTCK
jgi:hypothetical protein